MNPNMSETGARLIYAKVGLCITRSYKSLMK